MAARDSFVKVTISEKGLEAWVNLDQINTMVGAEQGTALEFVTPRYNSEGKPYLHSLLVKERPEDILMQLRDPGMPPSVVARNPQLPQQPTKRDARSGRLRGRSRPK